MPDDRSSLRLAYIVYQLLTDPRGVRRDTLIRDLGIAERTYRKYRQVLREEFLPFHDSDGKTRVIEVVDGDSVWLRLNDVEETAVHGDNFLGRIAALYLTQQMFSFVSGTEVGQAAQSFFNHFRQSVKDSAWVFGELFRDLDRKIHYLPDAPKDYEGKTAILREVLHCLLHSLQLEVRYESTSRPEPAVVLLEPLTLLSYRSALYLFARGAGMKRIKTYAIDRILDARRTSQHFTYPNDFHPHRYTRDSFGIFREEGGRKIPVELAFANLPYLKRQIIERKWHPTQQFDDLPDGRLRMRFSVNSLTEVLPWILSFGNDVERIRPTDDEIAAWRSRLQTNALDPEDVA